MKNIAVFASGNGTNFEALADDKEIRKLAEIKILICDNPKAKVIERAKKRNINVFTLNPKDYASKEDYEKEFLDHLVDVDYIFLAGYMRILSPYFLENFSGKVINIHPSLLPLYKGKDSIKRAYEAGEEYIGVSIHFVNEEVDGGKIIIQDKLRVDYDKSLDEVTEEIHKLEHKLYTKTAAKILREEL
ncbi:phosphoribosylglycinamide formyltransferase [Peptoniphilus sp. GNH]|nr:phosphoribosylglycinamide formyltransferase [Clostridiales bacterium KA00134]UHR02108.1 phosphoribosylglycinamide formyltransferase [Peptoniphilus sp. GNH]